MIRAVGALTGIAAIRVKRHVERSSISSPAASEREYGPGRAHAAESSNPLGVLRTFSEEELIAPFT